MDTEIRPIETQEELTKEVQGLVQESIEAAHSPEAIAKYGVHPDEARQQHALAKYEALGIPPKDAAFEALVDKVKLEHEVQVLVAESFKDPSDAAEEQMSVPPGLYNNETMAALLNREAREAALGAPPIPLTFERLQTEQARWSQYNFGHLKSDYNAPFKGLVEELGELSHSLLKQEQGIRGSFEEHEANAKDAIGDMLVFMADLCTRKSWSMQEIIETTWSEVKARDWVKFPKNGRTE